MHDIRGRRLVLLGAAGLAKEIADLVDVLGARVVGYVDETISQPGEIRGVPVVPRVDDVECDGLVLGIGDVAVRRRLFVALQKSHDFPTLVHPTACVSAYASLGAGTTAMQHVTVNADAEVGAGCLLNVGCCVAHDCRVGPFVHLAPATQLGGRSGLGEGVFCGTGSIVLPDVSVGDGATLGAGAVATKDVAPGLIVVGVPARDVSASR